MAVGLFLIAAGPLRGGTGSGSKTMGQPPFCVAIRPNVKWEWSLYAPARYNGFTLPYWAIHDLFLRFGAGAREKFVQPQSAA
jgi:hypothetical protein